MAEHPCSRGAGRFQGIDAASQGAASLYWLASNLPVAERDSSIASKATGAKEDIAMVDLFLWLISLLCLAVVLWIAIGIAYVVTPDDWK